MAANLETESTVTTVPTISVVLPTYNAAPYLGAALVSIRDQTWTDFEVIVVDDGSTDESAAIVRTFVEKDRRFRYVRQSNDGVAAALNACIRLARGQWVARMDADDIAHPDRLRLQLEFLLGHPGVDVISAGFEKFQAGAQSIHITHPAAPELISLLLVFCCPICHPLVMAHRRVFDTHLYKRGQMAEDHELWCRVIEQYSVTNLQMELLRYRVHQQSETSRRRRNMRWATYKNGIRHLWRHRHVIATGSLKELRIAANRHPMLNWNVATVVLMVAKGISWLTLGQR